jgi:predicted RecA/RadA family phage recombinase
MTLKKHLIPLAVLAIGLCAGLAHAVGINVAAFVSPEAAMGLAAAGGMITYVQDGDILDLTPSAAVAKGEGYLFGAALFGVAVDAVASGVEGRFVCKPGAVVTINKTSALAIAVGDRLFWDATNKVVNKTTTAQVCVGVATEAAANPSSTVKMRLGAVTPAAT